ncbi:AN1-type zinc finger domain-containing protein [Natrarchaeobius sp. A-rgal3]|uniref:AN1-type zinc finger domain-containing protein n=1 Tax=Natrarchaeobius versutus TaxID=1679078 RepID=UPI003510903F
MGQCEIESCGKTESLIYTCNYCGGKFCVQHRLPERHDCISLAVARTHGPDFRTVDDNLKSTKETTGGVRSEDREVSEQQCLNCNTPVSEGQDLCHSCRRVGNIAKSQGVHEKTEKKYCDKCSNRVPSNKNLCLECRRKEKTIDSRSPDVKPTGELKRPETNRKRSEPNQPSTLGFFDEHTTEIVLMLFAVFLVIGVWAAGNLVVG